MFRTLIRNDKDIREVVMVLFDPIFGSMRIAKWLRQGIGWPRRWDRLLALNKCSEQRRAFSDSTLKCRRLKSPRFPA
jgi:hypothetical protein